MGDRKPGMGVRRPGGGGAQAGQGERRPRGPVNKAREGRGGRRARAREAGAGAREAPPLTITIDAPRIMKIMVFALMDIGRGRAGPERRPPAPAPPRPRPDAEPPAPPQRSARRAPTAAGRGGGASRGRGAGDAAAPGSFGRAATALAELRSAFGPASLPASLPPCARSGPLPPCVPASGRDHASAPPPDGGRTPPRDGWSVLASDPCPVALKPGHFPTGLAILERALGSLPLLPTSQLKADEGLWAG